MCVCVYVRERERERICMSHASILVSIDNMYWAQTQAFVYLVPLDEAICSNYFCSNVISMGLSIVIFI
uniref:Putative ovule protein n=1 Tax=Solanum chacoense TaxID=4108 RepID=A0A0V0H2M4_SOLCH